MGQFIRGTTHWNSIYPSIFHVSNPIRSLLSRLLPRPHSFRVFRVVFVVVASARRRIFGFNGLRRVFSRGYITLVAILDSLFLAPYYYWYSDHTEVSFASFSIVSLYEQTFWLPVLMQLLMTALTLYLLYHFCSNFVPLRQAYLMQPSCMSSLSRVLKISDALGSIERGRFNLDAGHP